ncbi:phosphopantetheine-binding protein [Streptomyces sp. TRM 70351]|uniref:phosphopantetheine-binding protein n=1 Tax=Streptomyces sp. TRM 70351 TaxID=3116552 RepID=UPI002E7C2FC3|nr:phosphopantetheine-binding protein [Streptomyces sp. TRM 70351]MEE1927849.1 phosphopantetheine-binding protein [Streptomyces sp. TRM 70351]
MTHRDTGLNALILEHAGRSTADSALADEISFEEDLAMDSARLVELLERVEEVFQITIPDDALAHLHRVGDLRQAMTRAGSTTSRTHEQEAPA